MAEYPDQSKPEGGRPLKPSRAMGSRKEDAGSRAPAAGRLKLKPPAVHNERVDGPRGKGPIKQEGLEPQPRTTSRKKAKPPESPAARATGGRGSQDELPDQVASRRPRGQAASGYVRLRVRVEDGNTSIVDSHLVDSPLVLPPTLHGEYAYEVTDGARLLHADSIPDLGVVRSFSDPRGTGELLRHHTYRESSYEFDVRVPVQELTTAALPRIAVILYRVKERAPNRALTTFAPLGAQFERELREVTRVSGIPPSVLPNSLRR